MSDYADIELMSAEEWAAQETSTPLSLPDPEVVRQRMEEQTFYIQPLGPFPAWVVKKYFSKETT